MTTELSGPFVPDLTLGWRLRMARETTGMGLREFAERIGVAPDTLTSAEKDRRKVRTITINAYALATGVDRSWLETGITSSDSNHPDGEPSADTSNSSGSQAPPTSSYEGSHLAAVA